MRARYLPLIPRSLAHFHFLMHTEGKTFANDFQWFLCVSVATYKKLSVTVTQQPCTQRIRRVQKRKFETNATVNGKDRQRARECVWVCVFVYRV